MNAKQLIERFLPGLSAPALSQKLLRKYPQLDELIVADLGDHIYLNSIVVKPKFRGKGIGRRVVGDIKDYARGRGLPLVLVRARENNGRLKRFYGKLGLRGTRGKFAFHDASRTMMGEHLLWF